MTMEYSDPTREEDPYSLPDVEVFQVPEDYQPELEDGEELPSGWYYWHCFPGCLPDSDPIGPFASEEAALANAQSDYPEDDTRADHAGDIAEGEDIGL